MASKNLLIDCKCLIFDESNHVLLIREPEHWETPGGRLKEDETPTECLVRETGEELGAEVEIIDKLPIFIRKKAEYEGRPIDVLTMYFFGRLLTTPKLNRKKLHREKIIKLGWFTPNDIKNIPLNRAEETQLHSILKNLDRHQ